LAALEERVGRRLAALEDDRSHVAPSTVAVLPRSDRDNSLAVLQRRMTIESSSSSSAHYDEPSALSMMPSTGNPLWQLLATLCDNTAETNKWVNTQRDKTHWMKGLPVVTVKQKYMDIIPPPAKGEGTVRRATYPSYLIADRVSSPEFEKYLEKEKLMRGGNLTDMVTAVQRILGFLEVVPDAGKPNIGVKDCETMVALCSSKQHDKLLESPLLKPNFFWSPDLIRGLLLWIEYHLKMAMERNMIGDPDTPIDYKHVLEKFARDIREYWLQRSHPAQTEAHSKKQMSDLKIIKMIDIPVLQAAVLKGYATLMHISDHFGNNQLPAKIRGTVNSCMAGGIAFDTFSGRKFEWEILTWLYVLEVLGTKQDFLVCSEHKTASTYGSIAKYLSPGLRKAFEVYASLWRPEGFKYFFVPANAGTEKVSLVNALLNFCKRFLAPNHVHPGFNVMRKLFHKGLRDVTDNDEALKELMVILDAHSKAVQGRHYILRDPEDDVKLAKQLVKVILRTTVTFPTIEDTADYNLLRSCSGGAGDGRGRGVRRGRGGLVGVGGGGGGGEGN